MQKPAPTYSLAFVFHPERDHTYRRFEHAAEHPFVPNPTAVFPRANAWWLAEAALLAYSDADDARAVVEPLGLSCDLVEGGGTACYVLANDAFAILAFRGTEPDQWNDILTDAEIVLDPWPTGRVHHGFRKAFEAVRGELERRLAALPARSLWVCGHSLGAALANLAADRLPQTRGVATFGSPRVGDPTFARAFDAKLAGRSLRYVNGHDVVTHVPPPALAYGHVGERRFIDAKGVVSASAPEIPHFFDTLFGAPAVLLDIIDGLAARPLGLAPNFLLEHMPKAYAIWTWNDFDAHG